MLAGRVNKDTQDFTRVVVDFSQWLDPGEIIGAATPATVTVMQEASWSVDPYVTQPPLPITDSTPLTVPNETIVSGTGGNNTAVQLFFGVGTPGLSYVVSFTATGQTSGRQKDIDIIVMVRQPLVTPSATPAAPTPIGLRTTTFTIAAGTELYLCDPTNGVMTANMPVAPSTGDFYTVKDATGQAATHNITVAGNGHNIEGASTLLIDTAYGFVNLLFTGTQWVQVSAPLPTGSVSSVETVSFTLSGSQTIYLCDTTAAPLTATLPASPTAGASYVIKDATGHCGTNAVTVAGNGYSIDGSASLLLDINYAFVNLVFTGTEWIQVG